MLTELHIQNFAIIDHLDLDFGPGLVILTGETGAGKSIIMDALDILMGGRADVTSIRSDADLARVEALLSSPARNALPQSKSSRGKNCSTIRITSH